MDESEAGSETVPNAADLLLAIWAHRWYPVAVAVVTAVSAGVITALLPPSPWEAETVVWVSPKEERVLVARLESRVLSKQAALQKDEKVRTRPHVDKERLPDGLVSVIGTAPTADRARRASTRIVAALAAVLRAEETDTQGLRIQQSARIQQELARLRDGVTARGLQGPVIHRDPDVVIVGTLPKTETARRIELLTARLDALESAPPDGPRLIIIDPAEIATQPPNPLEKNVAAAGIGGAIMGMFAALIQEWWQREMRRRGGAHGKEIADETPRTPDGTGRG